MKNIALLATLLLTFFVSSCENVIDLELDKAPPKLVVEAAINWSKGTLGNQQIIKLTTTSGFYDQDIPVVSGATVYISNSSKVRFDFIELQTTGKYSCTNFIPVLDETYTLTIITNGETYNATEKLKSVAPITRLEQDNEGGILGTEVEVKAFYTDPAAADNYYLFLYTYSNKIISNYFVSSDKFYQGNEVFSSSNNGDLEIGDEVELKHIGISKEYYEYMSILINVAGGSSGGPFQSPPATVRGNLINETNFDNFALGYFSLSETDSRKYTIE